MRGIYWLAEGMAITGKGLSENKAVIRFVKICQFVEEWFNWHILSPSRTCSHYIINNSPIRIPNVNKGNNDSLHKPEVSVCVCVCVCECTCLHVWIPRWSAELPRPLCRWCACIPRCIVRTVTSASLLFRYLARPATHPVTQCTQHSYASPADGSQIPLSLLYQYLPKPLPLYPVPVPTNRMTGEGGGGAGGPEGGPGADYVAYVSVFLGSIVIYRWHKLIPSA